MKNKNKDIVDGVFTEKVSNEEDFKVTAVEQPKEQETAEKALWNQYSQKATMAFELLKGLLDSKLLNNNSQDRLKTINSLFDICDEFQSVVDNRFGKAVSDMLDIKNNQLITKTTDETKILQ